MNSTQKGYFGSIDVWYNPNGLANILSLAMVTEMGFRVTMDLFVASALILHISENHTIRFTKVVQGLYVFDSSNVNLSKLRKSFSFLNTVSNNKSMFKSRDIRKAEEAVELNR